MDLPTLWNGFSAFASLLDLKGYDPVTEKHLASRAVRPVASVHLFKFWVKSLDYGGFVLGAIHLGVIQGKQIDFFIVQRLVLWYDLFIAIAIRYQAVD